MGKNEKAIFKVYRLWYIIPTIILGFDMMITGRTVGEEAIDVKLMFSSVEIFFLMVLHVLTIELTNPLYYITRRITFSTSNKRVKFVFTNRIHYFFLVVMVLQLAGTLYFGNMVDIVAGGTRETWNRNLFTMFLNMLKISAVFPIYYVLCRTKRYNKLYWLNIFMYVIWQILCGWSSIILTVAILEIYMIYRDKGGTLLRNISTAVSGFFFLLGALVYKIVWPIKNQIRFGFSFKTPTYIESLEKLLSRFTNFPISLIGVQNNASIAALYKNQGIWDAEIKVMWNTLVPGFLMDKNFRPLANIVKQSLYSGIEIGTGTGYNFFVKEVNLFCGSVFCFLLWNALLVLLICISVWLLNAFDTGDNKVNILVYLMCLKIMNGGDFEAVFSYGYLGMIYLMPIMIALGCVKVGLYSKNQIYDLQT